MFTFTKKKPHKNSHLIQPKPTQNFIKLYKQDLIHLLQINETAHLYEQAQPQQGNKFIQDTYVRNNQIQVHVGKQFSLFCSLGEFKKYGVGIYLFFLFLRSITILFFIKSLIAIVSMVIMFRSDAITNTEGTNFFLKLTLSNLNIGTGRAIVWALDSFSSCLSLIFIVIWNEIQRKIIIDCAQVAPLPSYYTIVVSGLPDNFSYKTDLQQIINRFGPVEQVYTVKDYVDYLFYYKILIKKVQKIRLQKVLLQLEKQRSSKVYHKLLQQFYVIYVKIKKLQDDVASKSVFSFISFRTILSRQLCIKELASEGWNFMGRLQNQQFDLKNMKIERCYMQPSGILWQNIHISRCESFQKLIIQLLLVFLVFVTGIAAILVCTLFQSVVKVPSTEGDIITDCSDLGIVDFIGRQQCHVYEKQYVGKLFLTISIPVIIIVIKELITQIINGLAYFRRYGTFVELVRSQLLTYWMMHFITTTLLIPLIHLKYRSFSFQKILQPLMNSIWPEILASREIAILNQFSSQWYETIGFSIILTGWLSFGLGYLLQLLLNLIIYKFKKWTAKRQKIQKQMNDKLKGNKLDIGLIYSQILTLICFVEFYSVGLPILLIFGTLSLGILYLSVKVNFVRYCRIPSLFNQTINQITIKILLVALMIHNFLSPLILAGTDDTAPKTFLKRVWYYGSYCFLTGLGLIYYLGRPIIVVMLLKVRKIFHHDYPKQNVLPHEINNIDRTFKEALKASKESLVSYRMDENPKYKYILRALYTLSGANAMSAFKNEYWSPDETSECTIQNVSRISFRNLSIVPFFGIPSNIEVSQLKDEISTKL